MSKYPTDKDLLKKFHLKTDPSESMIPYKDIWKYTKIFEELEKSFLELCRIKMK